MHKTKRQTNSWARGNTLILAEEQQIAVIRVLTPVQWVSLIPLRKRFLEFPYKGPTLEMTKKNILISSFREEVWENLAVLEGGSK